MRTGTEDRCLWEETVTLTTDTGPTHLPAVRIQIVHRLLRLLAAADSFNPSVALIRGDHGSGKSHLAALTAANARRESFHVAEVDARWATLPFAAVDQLTRQLGIRTERGTDALDRLHAFRQACQQASTGRAGVAIIVDNADCLADDDVAALHDLLIEPSTYRLFVLLTFGPPHPPAASALDFVQSSAFQRTHHEWLTLDPLTTDEVAQLVDERFGVGLTTFRFVRSVHDLTAGVASSAISVLDAVDALSADGRLQVLTGSELIEEALAEAPHAAELLKPVERLGPDVLEVARALATLRAPVEADEITTLLRCEPERVGRALATLEEARLTQTRLDEDGRVLSEFAIPLLGVALRQMMPTLRRRQFSDNAALLREADGRTEFDAQLALHYLDGSLPLTAERIERVISVAQELVTRSRYATARRMLEAALRRGVTDAPPAIRARALAVLAETLSRSGAVDESHAALDDAVRADPSTGGPLEALLRQAREAVARGREGLAVEILETALTREDPDQHTRLQVMTDLSRLLVTGIDEQRGRQLAEKTLALASDLSYWRFAVMAEISLLSNDLLKGRARSALQHARGALINAHVGDTDEARRARAISGVGHTLLYARTVGRGLHWIRRAHRSADFAEDLATASWTSQLLAEGCLEQGDWDEAAQWIARAVRLDFSLHRDRSLSHSEALDARQRALRGQLDPAWATALPDHSTAPGGAIGRVPVAVAHYEHLMLAGRPQDAADVLHQIAAELRPTPTGTRHLITEVLPRLGATGHKLNDPELAHSATEELAEFAGQLGDELPVAAPLLLLSRAHVASIHGEWAATAAGATAAEEGLEALGYRYRAAEALELAGEAAVRLAMPRAEEQLARAYSFYRRAGAEPRGSRVREMLHQIGGRVPRDRERPSILTRRQREVGSLAAAGSTDSEIASRLSISRRTATTHMHNILGRLGLGSRRELAHWFEEHAEVEV